jgi:hypothetical protein
VVVAAQPKNIGRFVTVLRPIGEMTRQQTYEYNNVIYIAAINGFHWWIEGQSPFAPGRINEYNTIAADTQLRPIGTPDDDAVDEMLLIAPTLSISQDD